MIVAGSTTALAASTFSSVNTLATSCNAIGLSTVVPVEAASASSMHFFLSSCRASVLAGAALALAARVFGAATFRSASAFLPLVSARVSTYAHSAICSSGGCWPNGFLQQWQLAAPPHVACLLRAALQFSYLHCLSLPCPWRGCRSCPCP